MFSFGCQKADNSLNNSIKDLQNDSINLHLDQIDTTSIKKIDQSFFDSLFNQTIVYLKNNQNDSAEENLNKIIRSSLKTESWGNWSRAVALIASQLQAQGQYERAINEYIYPALEVINQKLRKPDQQSQALSNGLNLRMILGACLYETNRPIQAKKIILESKPILDSLRASLMASWDILPPMQQAAISRKLKINSWQYYFTAAQISLVSEELDSGRVYLEKAYNNSKNVSGETGKGSKDLMEFSWESVAMEHFIQMHLTFM